jgi:hypothetical protein
MRAQIFALWKPKNLSPHREFNAVETINAKAKQSKARGFFKELNSDRISKRTLVIFCSKL